MTVINRAAAKQVAGPAVAANGNLFAGGDAPTGLISADGLDAKAYLVLQKTGAGTCSVTPQASFDGGVTWYNIGYQRTDATAAPARAVGAIAVTGGTFNEVFQLLDFGPLFQFVVSATAGAVLLTPYLYLSPL